MEALVGILVRNPKLHMKEGLLVFECYSVVFDEITSLRLDSSKSEAAIASLLGAKASLPRGDGALEASISIVSRFVILRER